MEPVRFGIIGCGMAARFHILSQRKVEDPKVKFTAAHDLNEKGLTKFCKYHKLTPHDTLEKFLQSDEFEAVLILVPHFLHEKMVLASAEAKKHVLCEKPMGMTLEECDAMIDATKKAGVKFMIAENHRFLPAHLLMKDLIDKNFIGDPFLARTYEGAFDEPVNFFDPNIWHFTWEKGGGGVACDQGVHKFAFLNWLLNDTVESAQAWLGKAYDTPSAKGEDNAIIFLRYTKGAMAEVTVTTTSIHQPMNSTEIHGTLGSLFEDHSVENPVKVFSSHKEADKKGDYYRPKVEHGPFPQYYIISARNEDIHFAECIQDDTDPEFTPTQAREAVATVLLSYLSTLNNRPTKMEELLEYAKENGTKGLIQEKNLNKSMLKNYKNLSWPYKF